MRNKKVIISGQLVNPNSLRNKVDRKVLREKIVADPAPRITFSMYRYVIIADPMKLRNELFVEWSALGVLGRTYFAREGFNSQMSVPAENFEKFKENLDTRPEYFKNIRINIAIEDDGKSFFKLTLKVRNKIVADGLADDAFDVTDVGTHLDAHEWNEKMKEDDVVIVDMRNGYESEVGHFEGAMTPNVDTFRDELPMVEKLIESKKDKKLMLYCTGGIRCEKASAYFKSKGFKDVYQLNGGIINYARQLRASGEKSKFLGKNFVFDERLGERITDDVLSTCHQCGVACDDHVNCKNDDCHLLFIQCAKCAEKYNGCCTEECKEIIALPIDEQRKIRQGRAKSGNTIKVQTRVRPRLSSACSLDS